MRNELIERYLDLLLEKSTPAAPYWNIEHQGQAPKWHYVDGCMINALLELAKITGRPEYFDFSERFIDYYIADDGTILGYKPEKLELDDVCVGRVLFPLYEATGKEKYRLAIERFASQLDIQPRTENGCFWHKAIYPDQVWLDGIYMAQPFRALYEKRIGGGYFDILYQVREVRAHLFDEDKKLYYHGWDCSKRAFWANPKTGCSSSFWLRAIGWFAVALADLIELTADSDIARETLRPIFTEMMAGLLRYRDPETGMYYQVVDRMAGLPGNYLETSGSSMVAYAMLKGARLGVLDKEYAVKGAETFNGICKRYLTVEPDGELSLGGICLMAGLGPENRPNRDGTPEYYLSEPVVRNDAKGVAPLLLCYTEMLREG